jgi:hypothetical protein
MIYSGGFVGAETEPHGEWAPTQDGEDIDGARLFSTQPTQATTVCVDDYEDVPTGPVLTTDDATKKEGGEPHDRRIQRQRGKVFVRRLVGDQP